MLDWTGERFVPWVNEPAIAYEHLHRYLWAAEFAKEKKVLDLASGEGYGANVFARSACAVVGVDIDEQAIRHASERYPRSNLRFLRGSLSEVPISEPQSFDVITCFEAIEHIDRHDDVMKEVKRLLKPEGIFIVSTPNKETYNAGEAANPFHVKELAFDEFHALLTRYFASARYFGQRVYAGSSMWPIDHENGTAIREFVVERKHDEFQAVNTNARKAIYFVAVASDNVDTKIGGSVLTDCSDGLILEKDRLAATLQEDVRELVAELSIRDRHLALRTEEIQRLEHGNQELAAELERIQRFWLLRALRKISFGR